MSGEHLDAPRAVDRFTTVTDVPHSTQLAIVVPCFNEEEVLSITARRLDALLAALRDKGKISAHSKVYFVDDGSRDRTWDRIVDLAATHRTVVGIKLSRNRGHQNALMAGLLYAAGDAIVSIDADLQDDETVIETMVDEYRKGHDIVYGVRSDRSLDTFFKRFTATSFYRLLATLGVEVILNHADFRLMSRPAIECLRQYDEANLYLRGIIPQLGFASTTVSYRRSKRVAGESKYSFGKMVALSMQGITSFSILPLRAVTALGLVISLVSLVMGAWAIALKLLTDRALPGWASTVVPLYFLGGLQLLSLGVIGEYLGKVYMETKRRPRFTIQATTEGKDDRMRAECRRSDALAR